MITFSNSLCFMFFHCSTWRKNKAKWSSVKKEKKKIYNFRGDYIILLQKI